MRLTQEQFLNYVVNNDIDLYNPETEQYVFHYNENEAIMVYDLTSEEAKECAAENAEFWGGSLGPGGSIYDDPYDFTDTDSFRKEGWITCDDFAKEVHKMVTFNIYFNDLNEKAQKELMEMVGIKDPKEMNWDMDIVPLAMVDFEVEGDD